MWAQPLLLLLSLGIGVSQARPAVDKTTTRAVSFPTTKPHNCFDKGCTVEQVPVWDPVLGKCVCKWNLGPFPDICGDIACIAEMEVKYDPATGKCGCYWIPGFGPTASKVAVREAAAAPATTPKIPCTIYCISGTHLEQNKITGACSCVKDPPCPGIVCIAEKHAVYDYATGRCTCQWIDGFGPVSTLKSTKTTTKPTPTPTPTIEPCFAKCPAGYSLERDFTTGKCRCVPPICPDIICIAEMSAAYDPTTQKCGCQWIPGLEPSLVSLAKRATETLPIPIHPSCPKNIYCIPEMHFVYDPELKRCTCKWIPGLEPTPVAAVAARQTTPAIVKACTLLCIQGYHQFIDANGVCSCVKDTPPCTLFCIKGYHLSTDANGVCSCVKDTPPCAIRCAQGYHLQYDKEGVCFCEKDVVPKPCYIRCALGYHTSYDKYGQCYCKKDAEPLPCGIRCIDGYHLETSLDTGKCSCEKDATPVLSVRSAEPTPTQHPCATIKCGKGYHTFINTKGVCSCVKDVEPLPCNIRCKKGYHLETSLDTGKCSCVRDPVEIPPEVLCLKFTECLIGHPVWNSDTQTCGCATDGDPNMKERDSISCCAATLCRPNTRPVCHGRKCVCEPIPDYEQLCLIATTCLTGSHPVWDSKTKKCSCVGNTDPEQTCIAATTCLAGSQPVWNAGTQTCTCQSNAQTICETATECIPGSTPVWNAKLKKCECIGVSRT